MSHEHIVHNELNRIADIYRAKKDELKRKYDTATSLGELDELQHQHANVCIGLRQFIEMTEEAGYLIDYTQGDLK